MGNLSLDEGAMALRRVRAIVVSGSSGADNLPRRRLGKRGQELVVAVPKGTSTRPSAVGSWALLPKPTAAHASANTPA